MSEYHQRSEEILTQCGLNGKADAAMVLADYFEELGDQHMLAAALDRAYGLMPDDAYLQNRRRSVLDSLSVTEHGMHFRYVPSGTFLMGSNSGDVDERPVHAVRLDYYWIAQRPITWAKFVELAKWSELPGSVPDLPEGADRYALFTVANANKIRMQYCSNESAGAMDWHRHAEDTSAIWDEKPMVAIGWQDADVVCEPISHERVQFRLPTEAQWERAARGGLIGAPYCWGHEPPNESICDFNHFGQFYIRNPMELPANGYGIHGMCGGVWEWTTDIYDSMRYENDRTNDQTHAADSTATNEQLLSQSLRKLLVAKPNKHQRVLRGGSWADGPDAVTVSFRDCARSAPWNSDSQDGFLAQKPTIGLRLCRFESPTTNDQE